jgi:hypothetical protein
VSLQQHPFFLIKRFREQEAEKSSIEKKEIKLIGLFEHSPTSFV